MPSSVLVAKAHIRATHPPSMPILGKVVEKKLVILLLKLSHIKNVTKLEISMEIKININRRRKYLKNSFAFSVFFMRCIVLS